MLLEAGRENAAGRRKFLQPPQRKRPERGERKAGQDLGLWVPSFILLRNPVAYGSLICEHLCITEHRKP